MSKKLAGFYFLMILSFVAPEDGSIYEYNSGNFKHQIEGMDGSFVMFYAPWCRHCTEFEPIWSELAELVNTRDSKFAIAQVDCTRHFQVCHEVDITGYPTLLYFHKNSFTPLEYKGTRDLPSLTMFLSEIFTIRSDSKQSDQVRIHSGMAYLNDHNIEKFVSKGQHFIMFYTPWCRASQKLSPTWAELAVQYTHNPYIQVGKLNCLESELTCKTFDIKQFPHLMWIANGRIMGMANAESTLSDFNNYVTRMLLAENHDPDKFMKKKKALPVARISEETFETFLEKELVFVNFFAPWCAHCMQLSPLWTALGEKFMNESRVLIADVDCAQSKHICATEKISGLPTLILYKHKKIVNVDHGSKPLDSLIGLISEHLGPDIKETTEQPATKDEL